MIFLLDKPVDLKRSADVRKVNVWIRLELNKLGECEFDKISDIPRILRLPGTINHKYAHKPACEVVDINENTYRLDDFLEKVPVSFEKSMIDTSNEALKELYKEFKFKAFLP